jgi:hypothetical protein
MESTKGYVSIQFGVTQIPLSSVQMHVFLALIFGSDKAVFLIIFVPNNIFRRARSTAGTLQKPLRLGDYFMPMR